MPKRKRQDSGKQPRMEKVNISIADAYLEDFEATIRRCEQIGLAVDQALAPIGVVTGSIAADKLPELEKVAGVASVERQQPIQLPPSDSDAQ